MNSNRKGIEWRNSYLDMMTITMLLSILKIGVDYCAMHMQCIDGTLLG